MYLYISPLLSIQLIFIKYLKGCMCPCNCLYPLFIRVDLDGQEPFLGDLIFKWDNSSRCRRNFCQNSGTHQESLDKRGASVSPSGHQYRPYLTAMTSFWSDILLQKLDSGFSILRLSHSLPFQPQWSQSGMGAAGMSEFWKALKMQNGV